MDKFIVNNLGILQICSTFVGAMKYTETEIEYHFSEDWQADLLEQSLADIGFETFVPLENGESGVHAFIQTEQMDEQALKDLIATYPDAAIRQIRTCEDANWNATWEEEHREQTICIGDQTIRIVPHCAFGSGYHETTSMMLEALEEWSQDEKQNIPRDKIVLDNGCGTGVLGIAAAKMGAKVVAVDIDDKSVENTHENAQLNGVEIDVHLGNNPPSGAYDLIMSNIHRNVLVQQMALYAAYMKTGGHLLLSGFLEQDCPILLEAAEKEGLHLVQKKQKEEWILLHFKK